MTEKKRDISVLVSALNDPDFSIRFNAGLDLVKMADARGIPPLIEAFEHESYVTRVFHAMRALVDLGEPAVPALHSAHETGRIGTQVIAAAALIQIDENHRGQVFQTILNALHNENRQASMDALLFTGSLVEPVLRIPVSKEDLPVEVWVVDNRQIGNNFVQMTEPHPFLADTQFMPIRPGGKPPWMAGEES